jgi:UDP-glucose 4-epimerase
MNKVLVTGASGFIGRSLCETLRTLGIDFIGVDLAPHDSSVLKLDICNPESLKRLDAIRASIVVHLAAQVDVVCSHRDPIRDLESNILGTVNVLQAAIRSGVVNFIYISSGGAIYDENGIKPTSESGALNLKSPYGVSKLAGEYYVKVLAERNGIAWSSLALSNCYGPVSQCQKGVIFNFWRKLRDGNVPTVNGSESTRDFIHVSDVNSAILKAIAHPTFSRVNISTGKETSLLELYGLIANYMNVEIDPKIGELDSGEVARSCLDNSLATFLLDWKPKITIEEGIRLVLP